MRRSFKGGEKEGERRRTINGSKLLRCAEVLGRGDRPR